MNHRQINKAFRHLGMLFVILAQTSKAVKPSQSAFNNPAFWQNMKTFLFTPIGDLGSYPKDLLTPVQQGITGVTTIKYKQGQSLEQRQAFQQPTPSNFVLLIGWVNQNLQQPTLRIYSDLPFAAFSSFVRIKPNRPLFSAVCTDWLSTITTLGSASRSAFNRISVRRASLIATNAFRSTRRFQKAYTASHAGKSCGNIRHWQPDRFKYKIALNISRRLWTGLRPRLSRFGSNGSTFVHCSSLKSVG